jgi:hypothetical protein
MVQAGLRAWCAKLDFRLGDLSISVRWADFSDVSEITKAPEILGGRVKTLHPSVHGGTEFLMEIVDIRNLGSRH